SATLRRGHEGAAVVQLQRLLASAMPGAMKPRIDGHFGPSTEHALRCFQAAHGLLDSGVADAATWRTLAQPRTTPRDVEHATGATEAFAGSAAKRWMDIARAEIGQGEVAGSRHNPRILEYHASTRLKPNTDEIPWCASFVNWVMQQAGFRAHAVRPPPAGSRIAPLAFDATDEGTKAVCRMPAPGTVGHRSAAIGGSGLSETLRRGHEGAAVVRLQRLLASAMPGAMKPRIDGHFGPSTEHAVRRFQAAHGLLDSGVADAATWRTLAQPRATPRDVEHATGATEAFAGSA